MNYGENILFLSDLFVLQVTLVNAQISMHANLIPFSPRDGVALAVYTSLFGEAEPLALLQLR